MNDFKMLYSEAEEIIIKFNNQSLRFYWLNSKVNNELHLTMEEELATEIVMALSNLIITHKTARLHNEKTYKNEEEDETKTERL